MHAHILAYLLDNPVEPVYYVRDRLSEITLVPGAAKGSFLVPHAGGPERAKIEVGDQVSCGYLRHADPTMDMDWKSDSPVPHEAGMRRNA